MAKDGRLYGKFTLDFPDSPKILPLSDAAFRCLVEATLWSRQHMTDGLLARRYAVARWSLEVLQELCENDPENPSLVEVEKGYLIHDFDKHQDTKADIEARSRRNKIAGQKGGLAKRKQVASESLSENEAETETETHITTPNGVVRSRATKLPDSWTPTIEHQSRASETNLDLQLEVMKFRSHAHEKGRTAKNWNAAFTRWLINAAEFAARDRTAGMRPTYQERQAALWDREMEQARLRDERNLDAQQPADGDRPALPQGR
ncbi:hypothetical protein SAMN06309944_0229 [Micrococcales bacterium KH10]|nr:hypothetical protein SAMN06309944_0229 [Micrococcales bacterium KH10]